MLLLIYHNIYQYLCERSIYTDVYTDDFLSKHVIAKLKVKLKNEEEITHSQAFLLKIVCNCIFMLRSAKSILKLGVYIKLCLHLVYNNNGWCKLSSSSESNQLELYQCMFNSGVLFQCKRKKENNGWLVQKVQLASLPLSSRWESETESEILQGAVIQTVSQSLFIHGLQLFTLLTRWDKKCQIKVY